MSELRYDEELPFAVLEGQYVVARFPYKNLAEEFVSKMGHEYNVIVDTTPKPKIPEDAEFIVVESGDVIKDIYQKMPDSHDPDGYYWFRALDTMAYGVGEMDDLIGDSKVTALVRKESE